MAVRLHDQHTEVPLVHPECSIMVAALQFITGT